jgi:hypothetical protein
MPAAMAALIFFGLISLITFNHLEGLRRKIEPDSKLLNIKRIRIRILSELKG